MKLNPNNHKLGFGTDRFFERIDPPWLRVAAKCAIAFLVVALLMFGMRTVYKAADVVVPLTGAMPVTFVPMQTADCHPDRCDRRYWQVRFAKNKFLDGKMGRATFTERELFRTPLRARRLLIRKIDAKMDAMRSCTGTHCRTFDHTARWYYFNSLKKWSCFGDSYYRPWTFGTPVCKKMQQPIPKVSNATLRATANLIFCGAVVGVGYRFGGSRGVVLMAAAAGCGWDFFMDYWARAMPREVT